jgi:hypothetical protein
MEARPAALDTSKDEALPLRQYYRPHSCCVRSLAWPAARADSGTSALLAEACLLVCTSRQISLSDRMHLLPQLNMRGDSVNEYGAGRLQAYRVLNSVVRVEWARHSPN